MTATGIQHDLSRSRPHGTSWKTYLFVLLSFIIGISAASFAQTRKPTEFEVKAAYLFNFGKFVKWPSNVIPTDNSFPICILGTDPFGPALDAIVAGESLEGKTLAVQRISTAAEAAACRILFVAKTDESRVASIMSALRRAPVLTVSDMPDFLDRGGIVQFVMQGDKIRFHVNLSAAERCGLTLNSELLKVAVSVKRDTHPGE